LESSGRRRAQGCAACAAPIARSQTQSQIYRWIAVCRVLLSRPTAGAAPLAMEEAFGFDSPVDQPSGTSSTALQEVRNPLAQPRTHALPMHRSRTDTVSPFPCSRLSLEMTFKYGDRLRCGRCVCIGMRTSNAAHGVWQLLSA